VSTQRISAIYAYLAERYPRRRIRLRSWRYDGGSLPADYDPRLGVVRVEDYSTTYLGAPAADLEEPYEEGLTVRISADGTSTWVSGALFPTHAPEPFSQWVMHARYVEGLEKMPDWSAMHTQGLRV